MQLTDLELKAFKTNLETECDTLRKTIDTERAKVSDQGSSNTNYDVKDRGDESNEDLYSDLAIANIDHYVERLSAAQDALNRLANHTFGLCTECSGPISIGRLEADPTVSRCIACQTRLENVPSGKDATPSL